MGIRSGSLRSRRRLWQYVAVMCGVSAFALTGCASGDASDSGDNGATSPEQAESTDTADSGGDTPTELTAGEIVAVIEPQGFECTVEESPLDSRDEVVACKGDDYVIITATSLVDPSGMQDELAKAKDTLCKNQDMLGIDTMRTAVSGKWVFTPGGDDDKNLAAFDTAMQSFGLEWTEDPC